VVTLEYNENEKSPPTKRVASSKKSSLNYVQEKLLKQRFSKN
jgi:hypothetical protein